MKEAITKKARLRVEVNQMIKEMTSDQRRQESLAVCKNLRLWSGFQQASSVLLYAARQDEVNLFPLMEISPVKTWLFPRVAGSLLSFHRVLNKAELQNGAFGLLEPAESSPALPLEEIECLLIPGRAFDPLTGTRLGRGGGFYDRALAQVSSMSLLVGVAFRCQIKEGVPNEPHDRKMGQIVSPNGLEMGFS